MKYQVTIGERTVEVDLAGAKPVVDGRAVDAELASVPGTSLRHLLLDGRSHAIVVEPAGRTGAWRLTIGGSTVEVTVLDERTRAILDLAGEPDGDGAKIIVAPMPGLVVRVNVQPGDPIEAGQGVVVVEAMKMENELKAPSAGIVSRIAVVPGQAVEKG